MSGNERTTRNELRTAPMLFAKGAGRHESGQERVLEEFRVMDPAEAAMEVVAMADLEDSKRQVRKTLESFHCFMKEMKIEKASAENLIEAVPTWVMSLLKREKRIKRSTTLMQKIRLLQAALPNLKIMQSTVIKKFMKGLGRTQGMRPVSIEIASSDQILKMRELATDPQMLTAMILLTRGAARLSDLRVWLGGQGAATLRGSVLQLQLERRKTDQAGASPMEHIIGPIRVSKEDQIVLRKAPKALWSKQPLENSEYKSARVFLENLQAIKKRVGIGSLIALRRARARAAGKKRPTADVADLLGHKPNSKSTKRYMRSLDCRELKARLAMTA